MEGIRHVIVPLPPDPSSVLPSLFLNSDPPLTFSTRNILPPSDLSLLFCLLVKFLGNFIRDATCGYSPFCT